MMQGARMRERGDKVVESRPCGMRTHSGDLAYSVLWAGCLGRFSERSAGLCGFGAFIQFSAAC